MLRHTLILLIIQLNINATPVCSKMVTPDQEGSQWHWKHTPLLGYLLVKKEAINICKYLFQVLDHHWPWMPIYFCTQQLAW